VPPNPIEEGGMQGERRALSKLRQVFGDDDWYFFAQPLLPDPDRTLGRYEIDIIGLAPNGIVLIEVKYWKGPIRLVNGRVRQGRRSASDLFGLQQRRIDSFQRLFRTVHQRPSPEVRAVLLLSHPRGEPDEALLERADVRTFDDLHRLPEALRDVPKMETADRDAVARMLEQFGTWDRAMHRGPMGAGLRRWGIVPEDASGLSLGQVDLFDRAVIADADITLRTSWWRALFRSPSLHVSANLRDGSRLDQEVDPESRIPWIQPGKGRLEDGIPLYSLKRIVYGRESREDPRHLTAAPAEVESALEPGGEQAAAAEPEVATDDSAGAAPASEAVGSAAGSEGDSSTEAAEVDEGQQQRSSRGERWKEISQGQTYEGTVDGWHEKHGMFVEILPSVNGLLPMRYMPPIGFENLQGVYRKGSGVRVVVRQANGPRRILLDFTDED